MGDINQWKLSCQGQGMTWGDNAWYSWRLAPGGGYGFCLDDIGDGTVVFAIRGGDAGEVGDMYCTATNSPDSDYQVVTVRNATWNQPITEISDAAKFKPIPTGDGYFALFSPAFNLYVTVNPANGSELQVRGQTEEQAARFTAAGVNHASVFDFLTIGKNARGLSFAGVWIGGQDLSGDNNLSLCDFTHVVDNNFYETNMKGANLQKAKFAGADPTGLQISGADCTGADFTGCDFTYFDPGTPPPILAQAILIGATVPGKVSWAGANMPGARLGGANLTGCDLSGPATNLAGAIFHDQGAGAAASNPATLTRCNLSKANLSKASFAGLDLTTGPSLAGTNLSGAVLAGATLSGVDLAGATLSGADLTGAKLAGTDFTGTDLSTTRFSSPLIRSTDPNHRTIFAKCTLPYAVIGLDWSCLDLTGATLTGLPTNLTGLNATGLRWPSGNFSGYILDGATFTNAVLDQALFTKAKLRRQPSFTGAKLIGAVFNQAVLDQADFIGATLGGVANEQAANFSYAFISSCDFSQANLYGVLFSLATVVQGTKFKDAANLQLTDFSGAYLPNADFTGAQLLGAKFDGAFMVESILTGAVLTPAEQGAVSASLAATWLQDASLDGTKLMGASLPGAFITDQRGQITYQYYDDDGKLTPEASMRYPAGSFPDPASFSAGTLCPNHQTYGANEAQGATMDHMMAAPGGLPQKWTPGWAESVLQAGNQPGSERTPPRGLQRRAAPLNEAGADLDAQSAPPGRNPLPSCLLMPRRLRWWPRGPGPCRCRILRHPMRPANIHGSRRRAGLGAELGHLLLERADAGAKQAAFAAAPGAADEC